MAGDSIKFNASLNTAAFESGAKKLQGVAAGAASGISQHFGKIAMAVAGITAAFLGVRAAAQSFHAAIAMGGQLNDLSARTGETAGNLAILQRAFQNAGAGAEAVGPTINRLQRAIVEAGEGSKTYATAFQKLGLDLADLKTKTPTEQLRAVAEAIKGIENPSDQTAIAMQILGRSGGELMPLLKAMGVEFDRAGQQLGSLPGIIDRTNEHLDRIGDNFKAIGEKGKEFMVGLLEKLAPGLADLTDRLANIDAAGFGAKLSEYAEKTVAWITETFKLKDALNQIEVAINAITQGNFAEGFQLMFMTARNTAFNAINEIVAMGMGALETLGNAMRALFSRDSTTMAFIEGSFQMLGAKIASGIYDALAGVLEKIPFMGAAAAAVREAEKESKQAIKDISNIMYYEAGNLKKEWGGIMAEMPKKFAESYAANAADPLIDMRDRLAEAEELSAKLAGNIAEAGEASKTVDPAVSGSGKNTGYKLLDTLDDGGGDSGGGGRGGRGGGAPPFDPTTSYGAALRERGAQSVKYDPARVQRSRSGLAIERIKEQFTADKTASAIRGELARMDRNFRSAEDRASDFESKGMTSVAERMRGRIDARRAEKEKRLAEKFGLNVQDQTKSDVERALEQQGDSGEGGGRGGRGEDPFTKIATKLDTIITEIKERLPQVAMGTS